MAGGVRKHLNSSNLNYLLSRGSTAAKMARTGARGNPEQLGMGTASPIMAVDVRGFPIPIAIKHSFAEGLSPAEYVAMSYGGRASTVATQLSTELPGALFKKLTPNVFHEIISTLDCHTKNGILVPKTDIQRLMGHFDATSGHIIDGDFIKHAPKMVKVRTPLTCEAHDGVCQKCYGIAANGKLPNIGENVGVIAAQSVSEVLTQSMLSTKHTGGVAGKRRSSYDEASNILNNPAENFLDEAGISTLDGKVTDITQTPLKDYNIFVNKVPHFVSKEQTPTVKPGDRVQIGDQLSTGTLNPRKLVDLKGLGAGRKYLSEKLREIYGSGLDPRHFDLISKNMIKYVTVDEPGDTGFAPGQKVNISEVEEYLKDHGKQVPLSQGRNKILSRRILELTPGTKLTDNHIDDLALKGVTHVSVSNNGLVVTPLVPGLQTVKLLDKNWVSKMSFNKLGKTLENAASFADEADIHSNDPITSYTLGTEFGEGEKGKY